MAFIVGIWIAVIVFLLLLATVFSRVRIRVRYAKSGEQDHFVVIVHALYGAYRYRLIVPSIMLRGKEILFEKKASAEVTGKPSISHLTKRTGNALFKYGQQMLPWMLNILRKVECTRFRLDFRIGTGDAPSTAIVSGVLWSVYGCAVAAIGECLKLKTNPHGAVQPVYDKPEFSVVGEADFQIRLGTFAGILLFGGVKITALLKSWNSWRHWLNEPQHT